MSISLPKYIKKTLIYLFIILLISCEKSIDNSNNRISIERFENLFYNSTVSDLDELKKVYPYFFPNSYPEKVWTDRLKDPVQLEIFNEIQKEYETVEFLEKGLYNFFKNHKKLFYDFDNLKIITVNSDVDYRNRIILTDSILLIGLDNYLGANHRFYDGIPLYIKENFTRNNIISDIAEQFAFKIIPRDEFYTFLDKIIYYGKILHYKDKCMNDKIDNKYKIGYSTSKMNWAAENEYFVWTYFIQNDILFNPDNNLINRFISDAPFSVFYSEIDNKSSEMIGKYIGWQIVKSYMNNNNVTSAEMFSAKPIDIYNNSKYKPNKQ